MKTEAWHMLKKLSVIIMIFLLAGLSMSASAKHKKKPAPFPEWCQQSGFSCVRVKSGQTWQSLFPDETERGIVMRINRTNQQIYGGSIITVPDNLAIADLLDYSPFPRQVEAQNEKIIVIDLNENAWGAYDPDGILVRWGPATGGRSYCSDIGKGCKTKAGTFRVYSLGSSNCVSSKFPVGKGGAPMPYCMFFNGGQALHGSPGEVIRGNASHGCVRLFVPDAEWLRYEFVEPPMYENDDRGTKVVVLPY